jgi:intracellular septation protein
MDTMVHLESPPNTPARKHPNPLLKLALELGPLGVFFFANARGEWLGEKIPFLGNLGEPIFIATALFIAATLISFGVSLSVTRRLPIMPMVSGVVVVFFGGLTLWLQDDTFIKLKPTIVNVLFGSVLLGGLAFGKSFVGYVFDSVFDLTNEGWRKLTLRWGIFFFVLAGLNEIAWRTLSTDAWVTFKVFGVLPITLLFTLTQVPLIMREQVKPAEEPSPTPPAE